MPALATRHAIAYVYASNTVRTVFMELFLAKIASHPWVVGLLAVCFVLSMLGFWARIRREARRNYRRPDVPHATE